MKTEKKKPKVYTFALAPGRPKYARRIARIAAMHGVFLMMARLADDDWRHYFEVENAGGKLDSDRAEGTVVGLGAAGLWPIAVTKGTVKAEENARKRR